MIGAVIRSAMKSEHIDVGEPPCLIDPDAAFPADFAGANIETGPDLCCRGAIPALTVSGLLHLQPQAVSTLEIAGRIIRTAPSPFRFQREGDGRFDHQPAQHIVDEGLAESGVRYPRNQIGYAGRIGKSLMLYSSLPSPYVQEATARAGCANLGKAQGAAAFGQSLGHARQPPGRRIR